MRVIISIVRAVNAAYVANLLHRLSRINRFIKFGRIRQRRFVDVEKLVRDIIISRYDA